ncbi:MAG: hemolysin family protein [Vicinamibacterales bacterium]
MSLPLVLLVSLLFVILNAIFVAAEFALIAAPKPTLEHQARSGDRLAARLLAVLTSPVRQDRYIATAQLGITLASLGLGMYGEHALAAFIEVRLGHVPLVGHAAAGAALSLGFLTVVHIVIGEMVPKGVALQRPARMARLAHVPMQVMLRVLYPFVAVSNMLARFCLRLFGIRRQENIHEQIYTPEELQLIVEESERGGAIGGDAGKIVRELFEFGDLTASQVMVPRVRVVGIPVGATPDEIQSFVLQHRRTRYAVYEGDLDHIVGMLHAKDLLRLLVGRESVSAAEVRRIPVVPETASLDDVLASLQTVRAHMAVVIDEHGGTAGILNLEDLFEEVVGDIDEGAPSEADLSPQPDGSALVAGTVRLDELGENFDLALEHEEVDSVSGLVLAVLGRPPEVGDVITHGRLRLEVTAISGRGVQQARASVLPDPAGDSVA